MKNLNIFILSLIISHSGFAQLNFHRKLTLSNNGDLFCTAISTTSDSGFVLAGHQGNPISSIYYKVLIKFDTSGSLMWCRKYPETIYWESVNGIYESTDKSFLLSGQINNTSVNSAIVQKTDSNGTALWRGRIYTLYSSNTEGHQSAILHDAIYSCGSVYSQQDSSWVTYLIKLDSTGNLIWKKVYANAHESKNYGLTVTQDGNILLAGFAGDTTGTYGALVKVDTSGTILWQNRYLGAIGDFYQKPNGNYVFIGYFPMFQLTEVNAITGNIIWCKQFYNPSTRIRGLPRLTSLPNGDMFITVACEDSVSSAIMLLKLDPVGNQIFSYAIDNNAFRYRNALIAPYSDSKIAIYHYEYLTSNNHYAHLVLLDTSYSTGLCNSSNFSIMDSASSLTMASGNLSVHNATFLNYDLESTSTVSDSITDSTICRPNSISSVSSDTHDIITYPNPCHSEFNIYAPNFINSTLYVYDLSGILLLNKNFNKQGTVNTMFLKSGVYLLELRNTNGSSVKRKLLICHE